jgi:hypothetical protein
MKFDLTTRKKGARRLVILSALLLVLIIIYYRLGGFNEIEVDQVSFEHYHLAGQYIEGKYGDDSLRAAFLESKNLIESATIPGTLSILYYGEPEESTGKVKNFIGILVEDTTYRLPAGWGYRSLEAKKGLRARVNAHPIALPSPSTINKKLEEKAQEANEKLSEVFIERFISNRTIEVDRFLVD